MTARQNVRTHTRKTAAGGTTTVRQHARAGRGRARGPLLSPRHALGLARKAFTAGRRKRRWLAAGFASLAVLEVGLWAGTQGLVLIAGTAAVIAAAVAVIALSVTMSDAPRWGHTGQRARRGRSR